MDFLNRLMQKCSICHSTAIILLLWFVYVPSARAQLSPGKLQQSHAALEGLENCTRCHESGRQLNPQNCLGCHTMLNERIVNKQGLHSGADYKQCGNCHVEHQGRTADLIFWPQGQDKFDHKLTGYVLEGKHAGLKCRSCHTANNIGNVELLRQKQIDTNRTFLGLTRKCLDCHHDEHRGQIKKDCLQCHSMNGWKPVTGFDHDRTVFPLTGLHQQTACEKCHRRVQDNKYQGDSDYLKLGGLEYGNCSACHADVHQGRFGSTCQNCHDTGGWASISPAEFNHDRTGYPLRGRHALINCKKCHLPGKPLKIPRYENCKDCHNDYHRGQFVRRASQGACEECHTTDGYSPANFTIENHEQTGYPLAGAHLAVPCNLCHKKKTADQGEEFIQFKFESTACPSCHRNPHESTIDKYREKISAQTGRTGCEYCHSVAGWTEVKFDHGQTGFSLEGKHRQAVCQDCHKPVDENGLAGILFEELPGRCQNCHQDIHQGQFQINDSGQIMCQSCHTPAGWHDLVFDHSRDSRFPLQGAHQGVACSKCHPPISETGGKAIRYKPLDISCKACHGQKKMQEQIN